MNHKLTPTFPQLLSVTVEGSCEGRIFDERELKFEIGDGENLGFPVGVEKAIMAMEQEEEALFTMKPKYDQRFAKVMYSYSQCLFLFYDIIHVSI